MFSIFSPLGQIKRTINQAKHLSNVIQGKEELSLKGSLGLKTVKKTKTGSIIVDSFIDNVIKDLVKPKIGSVVYCGLCAHTVEHSGIYVGKNKIVHLDGSGLIEEVTPKKFLSRLEGFDVSMSIYVSCKGTEPIKAKIVAERAKAKVGERMRYNVFNNNCHIFSSGCLTGDFNNSDRFFGDLEKTASKEIGLDEWKVWDCN